MTTTEAHAMLTFQTIYYARTVAARLAVTPGPMTDWLQERGYITIKARRAVSMPHMAPSPAFHMTPAGRRWYEGNGGVSMALSALARAA